MWIKQNLLKIKRCCRCSWHGTIFFWTLYALFLGFIFNLSCPLFIFNRIHNVFFILRVCKKKLPTYLEFFFVRIEMILHCESFVHTDSNSCSFRLYLVNMAYNEMALLNLILIPPIRVEYFFTSYLIKLLRALQLTTRLVPLVLPGALFHSDQRALDQRI